MKSHAAQIGFVFTKKTVLSMHGIEMIRLGEYGNRHDMSIQAKFFMDASCC
jgi:hypothetical protein